MTDFDIDPRLVEWAEARSVQYYDAEARASLIAQFEISDELSDSVLSALEDAAASLSLRASQTPEAQLRIRKEMEKLYRTLSASAQALSNTSPDLWRQLEEVAPHIPEDFVDHDFSRRWSDREGEIQLVFGGRWHPDGEVETVSLAGLINMLGSLSQILDISGAIEKSYAKPGRKSDWPFTQWLSNMETIWQHQLGRKFTFDEMAGKAISPAAQFCVAAHAPFDAHRSEEEIVGKLRYFLRQRRQLLNWHK